MTAATPKSVAITNFEATPIIHSSPLVQQGRVFSSKEIVSVAAADSDADVFFIMPIHSSWCLNAIWLYNTAITDGTDYNLGLYSTAGVDVDENVYGDAISMASARDTAPINALFEIKSIANAKKQVWQDLALTSDPNRWYYLALTAVTVGTVAGTILVDVHYTTSVG